MKVYIYCTKEKPYLYYGGGFYGVDDYKWRVDNTPLNERKWASSKDMNGKIVASFDLIKVEKMGLDTGNGLEFINSFNKESQLTLEEIANYVGDNYYYTWHIDNLEILDKPIEFGKHTRDNNLFFYTERIDKGIIRCGALIKAPQSWQYVYDKNRNKCILISIKPEWVCKILNGEKTIEVRKTAPKEILLCQKN